MIFKDRDKDKKTAPGGCQKAKGKTTTAIEEEPYKEEELEKLENLNGKSSQDEQLTRAEKPKKSKKGLQTKKIPFQNHN